MKNLLEFAKANYRLSDWILNIAILVTIIFLVIFGPGILMDAVDYNNEHYPKMTKRFEF